MNNKILIVDDEPDILKTLETILTNEGFQVRIATSGIEAIEIFKAEPFNLVITDIRMPQMDGMEVLKQVKELDESVEVIILTGFGTIENVIMALRDEGAFDYLTKPLENIDNLLISVNRALERRRLRLENKNLIKKLEKANAGLKHEIEERKRTGKELQKSEERFKSLFQCAPDAYYLNDLEGNFIDGNKAVEDLVGYQKEELIGKSFLEAGLLSEEQLPKAIEHLKRNIKGQTTGPDEFILKRKDGGKVIVEIRTLLTEIDNKDVVLGIARDITKRKRLEEHLLDFHKMEAIATLAGGIAHQFNNALSSITGHTGLLEMEYPEDEKIMDYAKAMKQSAHRMADLTSQLLAYAGGGKYNPRPMSLNELVEDTLPLIQHILAPDIRLETDLPSDVMNVEVDRTQIQMVLSALIDNANEAIEGPGRIRITTRRVEVDEDFIKDHPGLKTGPYACLSIEDDGKGMDEETRKRIFDPFYTTHFIGRGLGMAAVYGIVRNHDGWISVDSELGKGTVVRIYLPAIEAKEEVEEKVVSSGPKFEQANGQGTILVIEDEEDVMMITRKVLEQLGYRVIEARSGKEGIDIAQCYDGQIDLALLDIKLPDTSGDKVYPLIMELRPDLKVIVFSGYTIDGPPQDILDAGAEAFIQKPFLISTLADKLKEVLEVK